jgi:hypothetical protein
MLWRALSFSFSFCPDLKTLNGDQRWTMRVQQVRAAESGGRRCRCCRSLRRRLRRRRVRCPGRVSAAGAARSARSRCSCSTRRRPPSSTYPPLAPRAMATARVAASASVCAASRLRSISCVRQPAECVRSTRSETSGLFLVCAVTFSFHNPGFHI